MNCRVELSLSGSLSFSGASVGSFLYATLQHELAELFGLDGSLLVIGALALNGVVYAGPMRPLAPPRRQ